MIKVVLVDDHQIVREGIRLLIDNMPDIEVLAELGNAHELITMLKGIEPDIAIIDISMPDMSGIELSAYLSRHHPRIKVLILSMYTSEEFVFNSIKAGASGYLPKNTTRQELEAAIREIMGGGEYFGESISNVILKSYIKKAQEGDEPEQKGLKLLSSREREVLELFFAGRTNKEIAEELYISTRTVESHKGHIMHKLELKTTVDLVKFAFKSGILEI